MRRLGEQALLAVDEERRADQPGRVEPAAGDGGRAGLERRVAGGRLEADAVRGAAGDHHDGAGARRRAAAVAEHVAALDRVHVEHGRARLQSATITEPQVGADPRAHLEVAVRAAHGVELGVGQVRDQHAGGRQAGGHHVGHQPLDLGQVVARGQRQVEGDALEAHPAPGSPGQQVTGSAQVAGGEAVPEHGGTPLQHHPGPVLPGEQGLEVLEPPDGVDHPGVVDHLLLEGAPRREHEQRPVVAGSGGRDLGVRPHRERVHVEPRRPAGQPGHAEAVPVALGDRHQARVGGVEGAQVLAPAVAVDVEGQPHRVTACSCRGRTRGRAAG